MGIDNPSIMSHVSIGTNDFNRATAFYDVVMATIGAKRIKTVSVEPIGDVAIAYGKVFPEFWINLPLDGKPAEIANGVHFAFSASSKKDVHAFWNAALEQGAEPDGEPEDRPHYGEPYYGCFMRDLDGHKIECMFWDSKAE